MESLIKTKTHIKIGQISNKQARPATVTGLKRQMIEHYKIGNL